MHHIFDGFAIYTFIFTVVILFGCQAENPVCTQNFCAVGEIFPRSELGDREFTEVLGVNDAKLVTLIGVTPLTPEAEDTTRSDVLTTDVLQPTTPPPTTPPPVQAEEAVAVVEEPVVEEPQVSFKDDIQPILAERCAVPGCHAAPGIAGLDLTQYDTFKKGGNGGAAFDAGNGKGSLVVRRIDGGGMPPIPPPLTPDQIQLFIDWIDEGAENN